jgi:hypothetical protein
MKTMKSVEAVATVSPRGTLAARVPPEIEPGKHKVAILIEEPQKRGKSPVAYGTFGQKTTKKKPRLDFPVHDFGPWPETLSLRREDMYGDDRR